jgi:hypothetical protein
LTSPSTLLSSTTWYAVRLCPPTVTCSVPWKVMMISEGSWAPAWQTARFCPFGPTAAPPTCTMPGWHWWVIVRLTLSNVMAWMWARQRNWPGALHWTCPSVYSFAAWNASSQEQPAPRRTVAAVTAGKSRR